MKNSTVSGRRQFLKASAMIAVGGPAMMTAAAAPMAGGRAFGGAMAPMAEEPNVIGPREGYAPQIGTLVSMMGWLRPQVVNSVKKLSVEQLDWLLDDKANTIGSLLYHLAATDAFYHEHTFKPVEWGKWDASVEKKFGVAMELGEGARKIIKGNNVDFYLDLLKETRESTLAEFRKRDDKWFMEADPKWFWGPTNNYCKWFHVCEHESHHLGQINFLKSRLPAAKS